jgi:hypothetical protein
MTHHDDDDDDFYASDNVRDMKSPGAGHNRGESAEDAFEGLAFEDLMREGRMLLFKDLLRAVSEGYATPQEKNTLRQMLKDNGMIAGDPNDGAGKDDEKPKRDLPSYPDPEYR